MTRRVLDEHGGAKHRKVFALDEFKGHRYFEIREFFLDQEDEWKPKKKGITLNKDTFRVLCDLIDRDREKISDWLGAGYVPDDVTRYEEVEEKAATANRYRAGSLVLGEHHEERDVRFFQVSYEGGEVRLSLNRSHPFASHLSEESETVQRLLALVIQAYHEARVMLAEAPAHKPEIVFMHLEQDWSKFLRAALEATNG